MKKNHGITHWSEALAVAMQTELGLAQSAAATIVAGDYSRHTIGDLLRIAKWTLYWKNPQDAL